ncbi:hypothetical protein G1C96_1730 [Bifidobacterium sp. DSM 109958]|uniref:Uncharacterized protein n=1 Tax=Bifidobacterium moraviense TaxID=2675323 RepID=A0A7Y0F331_9BIFI|nr:hypothetical protein [Bifidobacterium sp. DSM 109958]NMN01145.1 hypothetical protein [Bifidobacterium sp. DSM 109958]
MTQPTSSTSPQQPQRSSQPSQYAQQQYAQQPQYVRQSWQPETAGNPEPQPPQASRASQASRTPQTSQPPFRPQRPYVQQPQSPTRSQVSGTPRTAAPGSPEPLSSPSAPPVRRSSDTQALLLILGVGLVIAGVFTFATNVYSTLGDDARAACIGALGVAGLVVSRLVASRLRITAEGIAWAGLVALGIDARLCGLLEEPFYSGMQYPVTGAVLLGASLLGLALGAFRVGAAPAHPLRAYGLFAAFVAPWGLAMTLDLPFLTRLQGTLLAGACLTVLAAAAALAPSRRRPAAAERIILLCGTMLLLVALALGAFDSPLQGMAYASMGVYVMMMALTAAVWVAGARVPKAAAPAAQTVPAAPAAQAVPAAQAIPAPQATGPAPGTSFAPTPSETATSLPPAGIANAPNAANTANAAGYGAIRWIVGAATGVTALVMVALTGHGFTEPVPADLITAPFALMALAVGVQRMHVDPALRSWTALWPAMTFLFVPTLLMTWGEGASATSPRSLALFVAALIALLAGAVLGWKAPLEAGAAVLVAHTIRLLWPWITEVSRDYWWVWLLAAGVVLIAAAARYEASLNSMRRIGRRLSRLR